MDRETKDVRVGALKAQGLRASYFAQMGNCSFVDATHSECLAKYVNHSCQPNCKMYTVNIRGANDGFVTIVAIYALEDIPAGKELGFDYGNLSKDPFQREICLCQSEKCRGFM